MQLAEPAVLTRGLTKDFGGGRGVFDLDLEVRRGEILGFLGPNGAGKSTTLRLLVGLLRPTAGEGRVAGCDITRESVALRRRVGFLPGDAGLYARLTGAAVLAHLARLRGGVDRRRIDDLADRFDAELQRPLRELSTGNRQKVGLIQALMHDPELLILDEPIAGLDPLVQHAFHGVLGEVRDAGGTVLLSSHTLSEVDRVADRVAILRAGRLVVVDELERLRAVAVREWELEFAGAPDAEAWRHLPGVRSVTADGARLRIAFEGPADAVVRLAAEQAVTDIHTREQDLEDVFLRYYADEPR